LPPVYGCVTHIAALTDPEADLDPLLRRLFAEAHLAELEEPDDTALAEHLVNRLLGGPSTREGRIRAACVDAALRQRAFYRRRLSTMRDRLARITARAENPSEQFGRLMRDDPPREE
jgi:hypothetical protein